MKPGKKRFFLSSGNVGVLLGCPDRVTVLNIVQLGTCWGFCSERERKGTLGAKQGTGSAEALGTLYGLDMRPSNCRAVSRGISSFYFFGFPKALTDYERILRNNFQPYGFRSSRLCTVVQNILLNWTTKKDISSRWTLANILACCGIVIDLIMQTLLLKTCPKSMRLS